MARRQERPDLRVLPRAGADEPLLLLADRLLRAVEPSDVASSLLESMVTTYGFPRGAVLGRTERRLSLLARHGIPEAPPGVGSSPAVERAHDEQATQVVPALSGAREPWLATLLPPGADVLVLPLVADDRRALGALVLQRPVALSGGRGRRLLREVERAAEYAGLALDRVQRLAQLQRLAATDDLTMIANRRSFVASLDREIARSVRRDEPLSLVMLDLDHFKQVNDVHGHPAGDEALRNVAAALTIACRDVDTAARYGGEEFVVILPDCGTDLCLDIADRLRTAVAATPAVRPLSASAGVATFPTHAGSGEQLIQAADDALLLAKRGGRDRTVLYQPGSAAPAVPGARRAEATPRQGPDGDAGGDQPPIG